MYIVYTQNNGYIIQTYDDNRSNIIQKLYSFNGFFMVDIEGENILQVFTCGSFQHSACVDHACHEL